MLHEELQKGFAWQKQRQVLDFGSMFTVKLNYQSPAKWLNSVGMEGIRRFPIGAEESKAPFYKSENQDTERSDPQSPSREK